MNNSDKWIDRIAKMVLKLDDEDADSITRIILDSKRGEQIKFRVYWNNLGAEEMFDLLPTASEIYELVEVEEPDGNFHR